MKTKKLVYNQDTTNMPGGNKNIKGNEFGSGFDKNPQNINRKGQPPSIKNQLKKLLKAEGSLNIPAGQVASINEDGSVDINVPNAMKLAIQLEKWATSKKGPESLKAIQMIMEQIDGKPHQTTELNHSGDINIHKIVELSMDDISEEARALLYEVNLIQIQDVQLQ